MNRETEKTRRPLSTQAARRVAATGLSLAALLVSSAAGAETREIPIPKAVLSTAANAAFSSTRVRLDTYGPKEGAEWYKNDSYVLLPDSKRKPIAIPQMKYKIKGLKRYLKHYLNDVNSQAISAAVDGSRIRISVPFESQGEEIKGKCVRFKRIGKKWVECSLDMERDLELNNARLDVAFGLGVSKGTLVLTDPSASFKTDIKINNRLCGLAKRICSRIEKEIKGTASKQIEHAAVSAMKQSRVPLGDALRRATAFTQVIDPSWQLTGIRSSGSNYYIRVSRPDRAGR